MGAGGGGEGFVPLGSHDGSPKVVRRDSEILSVMASKELATSSTVFSITERYDMRSSTEPNESLFWSGILETAIYVERALSSNFSHL